MFDLSKNKEQEIFATLVTEEPVRLFLLNVKNFIWAEIAIIVQVIILIFAAVAAVATESLGLGVFFFLIAFGLLATYIYKVVLVFKAHKAISNYLAKYSFSVELNNLYIYTWFDDLRKLKITLIVDILAAFVPGFWNILIFIYLIYKYSSVNDLYKAKKYQKEESLNLVN